MKSPLLIIAFLTSVLCACNSSTQKEEAEQLNIYHHTATGWKIEIPAGYKALSQNRMEANEQKGKEAIGQAKELKADSSKLLKLVNFQKNQFNSFNATAEVFDLKTNGSYLENHQIIKKLIYDAYTNQNIKVDTLSGKELIDGQGFYTFSVKIYGPSGEVLMNQIIYNQLINGYDFGVNINYNNETDKEVLTNAFKRSTFLK